MSDAPKPQPGGTPFTVADLDRIIKARLSETGEGSYTRKLAAKGIEKCAQKMGEEAVEAVIAAVSRNNEELVKETADLMYHVTVALAVAGVSWDEVFEELARRTAQSGLAEKASRLAQD